MTHTFAVAVVDTHTHEKSLHAVKSTLECFSKIPLHVSRLYWISDAPFTSQVTVKVCHHMVPKITNFPQDYNQLILRLLPQIVTEDFLFIIQYDGFAVNHQAWCLEFLDYDYVGAVWPSWESVGTNTVGNGGFSLRSKKLLKSLQHVDFDMNVNEDELICRHHRAQLEQQHGIKFSPAYLAHRFSIEQVMNNAWLGKSLGFHGKHGIADWYSVQI